MQMMNRLLYIYDFVFTFFVPYHVKLAGLLFGGMHAVFFFVFQQPFQHVKTHKLAHQKYMWYATFSQRSHLILTHFQRQINIFKTTFQHHFYVEFWRWNNVAFSTLLQLQYATIFQRWNAMIFKVVLRNWLPTIAVQYIFLPAYSPDLNPAELCFRKVKKYLKNTHQF